jgi:hypothetical protein
MILREIPAEITKLVAEYNEDISDDQRLEIESKLDKLGLDFDKKADHIADCIAGYNAKAEFLDQEIERLKTLRDRNLAKAKSWKSYLANSILLHTAGGKLETDYHVFSFRQSYKLHLKPDANVPLEYCTQVPAQLKPELNRIKEAMRNGESIEGAWIEERLNLQIK